LELALATGIDPGWMQAQDTATINTLLELWEERNR